MPDDPRKIDDLFGISPALLDAIEAELDNSSPARYSKQLAKAGIEAHWKNAPRDKLLALAGNLKIDVARFESAPPPEAGGHEEARDPGTLQSAGDPSSAEPTEGKSDEYRNCNMGVPAGSGDEAEIVPGQHRLLQAALDHAEHGFEIFPIKRDAKQPPLITAWQKNATTDEKQIRQWWGSEHPGANVGTHCRDLIVLDIDAHKGGSDTLRELEADRGALPDTYTTTTPRGGRHVYLACPGGVPNSVERIGPGVDVRSNNGYVLAAGSTVDGKPYEVANGAPVAAAPQWLIDLCQTAAPEPVTDAPDPADIDVEQAIEQALEWLAHRAPAIQGQGGDAWTFQTICKVRDYGVPRDRCAEVLADWNSARCEPPWAPDELESKIRNSYQYAQNPPGADNVVALFDDISAEVPESVIDRKEQATANDAEAAPASDAGPGDAAAEPVEIHGADIQIRETWRRLYLIKHWLDQGSHAQLFGDYGQGKTFVALNMAAHIAAGVEWFGERVTQGGALYLLYEGTSGIHYRLAALKKQYPDWDWRSLPFVVLPINAPLVDSKATNQNELPGRKHLQAAIQRFAGRYGTAPAFLVVDTYSRAIGGSASDEELAGKFASMVGALVRRYSMTVMQIHHPGHSDKSRGRGSYSIPAGVDSEIRIGNGVIAATKERDHGRSQVGYSLDVVPLGKDQDGDEISSCTVKESQLRGPLDLDDEESRSMEVIRGLAGDRETVGRRAVLDGLRDAGVELGRNERDKAAKLYKRLKAKGYIDFDAVSITVLDRGAAGLFEDFDPAAEAVG